MLKAASAILKSETRLIKFIQKEYVEDEKSWGEVALRLGTYANRLRRFAKKHKIKSRDKSEAQSLALRQGRHKHPTKGKVRSEETKIKISESVAAHWKGMTPEEWEHRRNMGREQWDRMSEADKKKMLKAASEGVREASKFGSKLEKYLLKALKSAGFRIEFHKERFIGSTKLHLDLFAPDLMTIIEIDGPAHFFPIWGIESLNRHIVADKKKNGMLLENGYVVVRVKHITKSLSQKQMRDVTTELTGILRTLEVKRPVHKRKRLIEIEV